MITYQVYVNMKIVRRYKYLLNPKAGKLQRLHNILDVCRVTYNKILEIRKTAWETEKKSVSLYDSQSIARTWGIVGLHSQVLQNVAVRVDLAFQNFFRQVKAGTRAPGYPRFKAEGRYDSFTYPQFGFKLKGNKLYLAKVGDVRINLHRAIVGKIKTCTIKREGHRWYAIFACEINKEVLTKNETKAVGVDVGCVTFATFSDGNVVEHPHFIRRVQDKLSKAHAEYCKLDLLSVDDSKKIKSKKKLVNLHCKVRRQRTDFLHKLSRKLVNEYSVLCVEKLNIEEMVKGNWSRLNKSIMDGGWGYFKTMLHSKAEEAGSVVVEVNPAYTSQICSGCGVKVKKELGERMHTCPTCGLSIGRDLNAARNILRIGMDSLNNRKTVLNVSSSQEELEHTQKQHV